MARVHLFWDASDIWGPLAAWALDSYGLDWRPVSGADIGEGILAREKPSLLFVPGGFGSRKSRSLGDAGRAAVRNYVDSGGWYLGVCGGAGLGLSTAEGLALCPWKRVGYRDRLQHFMIGHLAATFAEHPLAPSVSEDAGVLPLLPVWWPGLFDPRGKESDSLVVLARYGGPGPDFRLADLPVSSLSPAVFADWKRRFGFSPSPAFLKGQPCVLHGLFGRGRYTLSYAHLETPDSPFANAWLASLFRQAELTPARSAVAEWDLSALERVWRDPDLLEVGVGVESMLATGRAAGLFFDRTPWLTGWRMGIPGAQLGSLRAFIHTIVSRSPSPAASALWEASRAAFMRVFIPFQERVSQYLLAEQLSLTLGQAVPELELPAKLHAERAELFGPGGMVSGGLIRELLPVLNTLTFLQLAG